MAWIGTAGDRTSPRETGTGPLSARCPGSWNDTRAAQECWPRVPQWQRVHVSHGGLSVLYFLSLFPFYPPSGSLSSDWHRKSRTRREMTAVEPTEECPRAWGSPHVARRTAFTGMRLVAVDLVGMSRETHGGHSWSGKTSLFSAGCRAPCELGGALGIPRFRKRGSVRARWTFPYNRTGEARQIARVWGRRLIVGSALIG